MQPSMAQESETDKGPWDLTSGGFTAAVSAVGGMPMQRKTTIRARGPFGEETEENIVLRYTEKQRLWEVKYRDRVRG